jgi:acyl carrier protein
MKNIAAQIKQIFSSVLKIPKEKINNKLSYVKSDKWDSLNHMKIVSQIEKKYKIQFLMKDVIAMETFSKSIKITERYIKKSKK